MPDLLFNYGVESLYVGSASPYSAAFESLAATALQGIQSANVALTFPRQDTFSWDGACGPEMITRPRAELTYSYVFASGTNENSIGLTVNNGGRTAALSAINTERNYYLVINRDRLDMLGYAGQNMRVMGLGNAVITQYSFEAAVGQPSIVNVTAEALNLLIQPSGSGQPIPAIYKQTGSAPTGLYTLSAASQTVRSYFEAAPGNILLTFDTGCAIGVAMSGANSCPVESFGFAIGLPRADVKDLGWAYPDMRPIQWPVTITIHADAVVNDLQLDTLNRLQCADSGWGFSVGFNRTCGSSENLTFQFDGAKLDSQNFVASIGPSNRVSLNWSLKIIDINRTGANSPNFYILSTGSAFTSIIFDQVDYVSGSAPLTFDLSESCFISILDGPAFLSGGNHVFVSDAAGTTTVRAASAAGTDIQDITVTVA